MPEIPPNQITLPLARFAEASGKSEPQVRKDIRQRKYESVIDGGRNMVSSILTARISRGCRKSSKARR
jgi:hypothetical protein